MLKQYRAFREKWKWKENLRDKNNNNNNNNNNNSKIRWFNDWEIALVNTCKKK